jgi:argonaute-like protein implicated in RNA metabolism and viral defense
MSQAQISQAPIYTRKELEMRLYHLERRLEPVLKLANDIKLSTDALLGHLLQKRLATSDELTKLQELQRELMEFIYDLIDAIIVRALDLDVDIDKYERQYRIKFYEDGEHFIGVALVKEGETLKPVVVWTDYEIVWYSEGEEV